MKNFFLLLSFFFFANSVFSQGEVVGLCENPDVPAQYFGGTDSLFAYLQRSVVYPKEALKNGDQGTVVVKFVVEKNGDILQVDIETGATEELENEALRVIRLMPNWRPAICDGHTAPTLVKLPLIFDLEASRKAKKTNKKKRL